MSVTESVAPAGGGSHFHQAVTMLSRRSGRWQRTAQALILAAALHETGTKLWRKARSELQYQVAVPGDDDIYDDVHGWLVENLPSKRRRALTARSSKRHGSVLATPDEFGDDPPLRRPSSLFLSYDGTTSQSVTIGGHKVTAQVERNERGGREMQSMDAYIRASERLVFTCHGTDSRDAVLAFLAEIADARVVVDEVRTRFYIATRWGEWNRRSDLPKRSLHTVVLRDGQRERIVDDLERFLETEALYERVGLPWHRGYLLHGPPGTGKTSMAKALAEHFRLDVHFIPLSDLEEDGRLVSLLSAVGPRSMLVLEDIDVVHASKSRDDSESRGVSLSGLLNALDGLATPHGLVTVMTTNDLTVLDPALMRPGRADRIEELGYLDDHQLDKLVQLIAGPSSRWAGGLTLDDLSHAEVIEAAKPYLDRPQDACGSILDLIRSRMAARV